MIKRTRSGKNTRFGQSSPEQLDHLTPLIFKKVGWSIKIGGGWSITPVFPRTARIFSDLMANRAGYPVLELNKFRKDNYPQYIDALNKGDDKDYSGMIEIIGNLFSAF